MDNSNLPARIKEWLNARGISDEVIRNHRIGWDGKRIVIPIVTFNNAVKSFNKYRRDPAVSNPPTEGMGPKYTYDAGAQTTLFNIVELFEKKVIICEGELDCLLLESKGFHAVSSTGGAGTFKKEWVTYFDDKDVYVLYDNDAAGREGAVKVCRLIPHAKYVPLPPEVGEHGDITDYFVKLGKTAADLDILLSVSEPLSPEPPAPKKKKSRYKGTGTDLQKAKAYKMTLLFGKHEGFSGHVKCPIHNEQTASLKIYPDNRWYCYGCGKGGDVIDFVMLRDSLTMPEAIKKILSL